MSKIELFELLQQDIEDIKGLIEYDLSKNDMKIHARGIIINLQEHLESLIKL